MKYWKFAKKILDLIFTNTFFSYGIRTLTLNLHKCIKIQYFKSLIRISLDLFIINKKKFFIQQELQ